MAGRSGKRRPDFGGPAERLCPVLPRQAPYPPLHRVHELTSEDAMYDPTIGRWISEDPEGFQAGDTDLYRYVHNEPTRYTDPSGMDAPNPYMLPQRPGEYEQWLRGRGIGTFYYTIPLGQGRTTTLEIYHFRIHDNDLRAFYESVAVVRIAVEQILSDIGTNTHPPVTDVWWQRHSEFDSLSPRTRTVLEHVFGNGWPLTNAQMAQIRSVFVRVRDGMDTQRLPFYALMYNRRTGPITYVQAETTMGSSRPIGLRPVFFEHSTWNQAGTILHELTHFFAQTNDDGGYFDGFGGHVRPAYRDGMYGEYPPTNILLNNADTYAIFAFEYGYINRRFNREPER